MSTHARRIEACFGKREELDPAIVVGCMVGVKSGEHKDLIGIVTSTRRWEAEVVIIKGTEGGPTEVLQAGQVRYLDKIDGAINEGDVVSLDLSRIGDGGLGRALALVTEVAPYRQSLEATILRGRGKGDPEHGDSVVYFDGHELVRTRHRFDLVAGQADLILTDGCIVRVQECRCDGRICKLLGPANGSPGPNLRIINLEDSVSGECLPTTHIHGISDDCVAVVSFSDPEVLDLIWRDRHHKRRRALRETPRHIPADQLTSRQVMARSAPHTKYLRVPSGCLEILHSQASARRRFCKHCLAEGVWPSTVCTDPGCIEWDQATSNGLHFITTFLEEAHSEWIENNMELEEE